MKLYSETNTEVFFSTHMLPYLTEHVGRVTMLEGAGVVEGHILNVTHPGTLTLWN